MGVRSAGRLGTGARVSAASVAIGGALRRCGIDAEAVASAEAPGGVPVFITQV